MKLFLITFAFGFVLLLGGIFWFLFGEDFVSTPELFRRFGLEMPAHADVSMAADQEGDIIFIAFRLLRREARDYVAHPLPGYTPWRAQGKHESFVVVGTTAPPGYDHLTVAEKWQGRRTWRIMVNEATGQCFAYYNVDEWTSVDR